MAKTKKLTKAQRTLVEEVENKKDYIAYDSSHLYAITDIPMIFDAVALNGYLAPPSKAWEDFDPDGEPLLERKTFASDNVTRFVFRAQTVPDGSVDVELSVYEPDFPSKKPVLLLGDRRALPQLEIIRALVARGCIVFVPDYNGCDKQSATVFPPSLSYGKLGEEGDKLTSLGSTPQDTCPHLYALIARRTLAFMREQYAAKEAIVVGIGYGTELAMQVAGTERTFVTAVGLLCGAGYPEYADIPKYPYKPINLDYDKLGFIISESGVSFMKAYPHPVFTAIGSNGTRSDVDRLSSLKSLVRGSFTCSISYQYVDNITEDSFHTFLLWLDAAFCYSDFPTAPSTTLDVNRDGSVYADIHADPVLPIRSVACYYAYGEKNHKTRIWRKVVSETIGIGEYLARMTFGKTCDDLFFYSETTYVNGMVCTEAPKYFEMKDYRISLAPAKTTSILYRYGADGTGNVNPSSEDAVIFGSPIKEGTVPSGAKGALCPTCAMRIFVADSAKNAKPVNILQVDSYSPENYHPLEIALTCGSTGTTYRAIKHVPTDYYSFSCTQFSCSDFKDETFRPLTSWEDVATLTILTTDVVINKIMFI